MFIVPQPYIGVPGTGALTLTFFGDAGVAGRADIAEVLEVRAGWELGVQSQQLEAV